MGLYEIKADGVEVETRSVGKPSSLHADSLENPQCAQSSIGDAQTQPNTDPCKPRDSQTMRWSQFDTNPCDPS